MSYKPTGNPNGRPIKEIDKKAFEALCGIQCSQEEICSVLDVCEDTLLKWCRNTYGKSFSEVFREKRLGGRASLRRMQWKLAEKSAPVSIWLGKQYLNQTDIGTIDGEAKDRLSDIVNAINKIKTKDGGLYGEEN